MPQSVYPPILPTAEDDSETVYTLEQLKEIGERVHKHLELITGLELEEGDI